MSPTTITTPPATGSPRAAANRANSLNSTGPRTEAGKQRSSMNALRHGLTAAAPVLPSEDRAAYEDHRRGLFDEYKPATPTESLLVQELVDSSWRLNRIHALEADAFARATFLPPGAHITQATDLAILGDGLRALAILGLHSGRLSRQFQKALNQLRDIQKERAEREQRDLKDAAALLEHHKQKGIPFDPAGIGFVFSSGEIERFARRLQLLNASRPSENAPVPKLDSRPPASHHHFFVAASTPLAP